MRPLDASGWPFQALVVCLSRETRTAPPAVPTKANTMTTPSSAEHQHPSSKRSHVPAPVLGIAWANTALLAILIGLERCAGFGTHSGSLWRYILIGNFLVATVGIFHATWLSLTLLMQRRSCAQCGFEGSSQPMKRQIGIVVAILAWCALNFVDAATQTGDFRSPPCSVGTYESASGCMR